MSCFPHAGSLPITNALKHFPFSVLVMHLFFDSWNVIRGLLISRVVNMASHRSNKCDKKTRSAARFGVPRVRISRNPEPNHVNGRCIVCIQNGTLLLITTIFFISF